MSKANPLLVKAFGQEKTIREWSEDRRCSVGVQGIRNRLRSGWPAEKAISAPKTETLYFAFGESKTLGGWYADPRCQPSMRNLLRRIEMGWDFENCLTTPEVKLARSKPRKEPQDRLPNGHEECFIAFCQTKSLHAWAADERCVIRYDQLRERLRAGWALEDALVVPMGSGSPHPVTPLNVASAKREGKFIPKKMSCFGEKKSLADWARDDRCKVSKETLEYRLARGMPLKLAMTARRMTLGPGAWPTYEAFGEAKTAHEWAKDERCVVSARTLSGRIHLGTPMEEALTRPVHRSPPKLVEAFGKRLPIFEWVKDPACSVNWSTLDSRLKLGWPPEEAISTPVGALPPSRQKPKRPERPKRELVTYECFGEHKTLSDWVRDPRSAVASRQAVLYRLKVGVPFLDALTLAQIPGGPRPRDILHSAFGEEKTVDQWASDRRCTVARNVLLLRVNQRGWPMERALIEPKSRTGVKKG